MNKFIKFNITIVKYTQQQARWFGLKAFYNGDVEFNELFHKVYELSYVPVEDVVKVYEDQIVSVIVRTLKIMKTG